MNKFIIATRIPSFQEMLNNANGIFIDNNDLNSLINSFEYCIKNIDEIRTISINSKNYILKNYTWEIQAKKIFSFIHDNINYA